MTDDLERLLITNLDRMRTMKLYGDDVAAALSAAMDSGEPIDPEGVDHCNYVIERWATYVGQLPVAIAIPSRSEDATMTMEEMTAGRDRLFDEHARITTLYERAVYDIAALREACKAWSDWEYATANNPPLPLDETRRRYDTARGKRNAAMIASGD